MRRGWVRALSGFFGIPSDMREARAEWAKRLEARAGTERLAETRGLSKPLACGYEVHADARKTRRQPGGPPEKGTATALCPRRLLNVSLVLFDCPACPLLSVGELCGGDGCGCCVGFLESRAICERRELNGRSDSKLEQAPRGSQRLDG